MSDEDCAHLIFDEPHPLFNDAPNSLVDKIVQAVRLIRAKGVGVYLLISEPARYPRDDSGPAGPPRSAAMEMFRQNPTLKTAELITELIMGKPPLSVLDADCRPGMVVRAF